MDWNNNKWSAIFQRQIGTNCDAFNYEHFFQAAAVVQFRPAKKDNPNGARLLTPRSLAKRKSPGANARA